MELHSLSSNLSREYDYVFVTHLPSFYKISLFNEIAKSASVLAIFLGETSLQRTADFVKGEKNFDYLYLNSGDFEQRKQWASSWRLCRILAGLKYKRISVGAWDLLESWVAIFCSPTYKNVLMQESSIFESTVHGYKGWLKKIFAKRLSIAFVSGKPHGRLMRSVGFKGDVIVTGGVGLATRAKRQSNSTRVFSGKFLYVGRLSPEKNLPILLSTFSLPSMQNYQLTMVGTGPQYDSLKLMASKNVEFKGHIPNENIHAIYETHDVFILPSISEVWGLVVEEALYYGLPVLVSAQVGSVEDLVIDTGAGLAFDPNSSRSLGSVIEAMSRDYSRFSAAARAIEFDIRDAKQVQVYVDSLRFGASE